MKSVQFIEIREISWSAEKRTKVIGHVLRIYFDAVQIHFPILRERLFISQLYTN